MATANPAAFIAQARTELRKVVWPTRTQTIKLTGVVVLVSVGIGVFIGGLDILFVTLSKMLLGK